MTGVHDTLSAFKFPLTNVYFKGEKSAAKISESEIAALGSEYVNSAHLEGERITSYARNRLALVCNLCDVLKPDGSANEIALPLIAFINPARGRLCRKKCCSKDLLPTLLDYSKKNTKEQTSLSGLIEKFAKVRVAFDWFDWFAERVAEVAAEWTQARLGAEATPEKKIRATVSVQGEQDVATHWNTIAETFKLARISVPFEFGSVVQAGNSLKKETITVALGFYCIALVSGLLPLSIETKFAVAYARICKESTKSLFLPVEIFRNSAGVPISHSCVPLLSSGSTSPFSEMTMCIDLHQNFGFSGFKYQRPSNALLLFNTKSAFLLDIIQHARCVIPLITWADVVDQRDDSVFVLNALLFVAPENLVIREFKYHIDPVIGIGTAMLPSAAFVKRHLNKVAPLLCNNLARFIYFAMTRNNLPAEIGLEYDDEDGTSRTAFMFNVSPFRNDRSCLSPSQMHCLASLYFGDFDFGNTKHVARLREQFIGEHVIRELPDEENTTEFQAARFSQKYLGHRVADREVLYLSDGPGDLAIRFLTKAVQLPVRSHIPYISLQGSSAAGLGPHKELARELFLAACRHAHFFLEINDARRTICVRKERRLGCRICSEALDGAPCVFAHDETLLISRAISNECILLEINLPVVFSFRAIVEAFGLEIDREAATKIEYADSGPISQKVSTLSMNEFGQLLPENNTVSEPAKGETNATRALKEHFGIIDSGALLVMYLAINKTMPFTRRLALCDVTVDLAREVVFRLCKFHETPLSDMDMRFFEGLKEQGKNDSDEQFASRVKMLQETSCMAASRLKKVVGKIRENRSFWVFLRWVVAASLENLTSFIRVIGFDPSLLALYSEDGRIEMMHHKYKVGSRMLEILETAVCEPETLLRCPSMAGIAALDSIKVLESDRIHVSVSEDGSRACPVKIATCSRSLSLTPDLRPSQLGPSMDFLLESPSAYNGL